MLLHNAGYPEKKGVFKPSEEGSRMSSWAPAERKKAIKEFSGSLGEKNPVKPSYTPLNQISKDGRKINNIKPNVSIIHLIPFWGLPGA